MRNINLLSLILIGLFVSSCEKFLDLKADSRQAIPSSIRDYQLLMDNNDILNNSSTTAQEVMADDYYLTNADLNSITNAHDRGMYTWEADDQSDNQWNRPYRAIFMTNVVIDGLDKITPSPNEIIIWQHTKGAAHFFRAFFIEGQLQVFSMPYEVSKANITPGVPLRMTPDFNEKSTRPPVSEGYNLVLQDLRIAAALLPDKPIVKTRPSKAAAFGLLAKVFLTLHQYDSVGFYAEKSLSLYDSLLDYNSLNPAATAPFPPLNREVIFFSKSLNPAILNPARAKIDSGLIKSYGNEDLRLGLYFRRNTDGSYRFKGDYNGSGVNSGYHFSGIVTDEQYLMAAEAAARLEDVEKAKFWLNKLLVTRYRTGTYIPIAETDPEIILKTIILERRKSLLFRGARWRDLRRFSIDPEFVVRPKRFTNSEERVLNPNSVGYRLLLPAAVRLRTDLIDFP